MNPALDRAAMSRTRDTMTCSELAKRIKRGEKYRVYEEPTMNADTVGSWIIMDERARTDTAAAQLLDWVCDGTRGDVPVNRAGRLMVKYPKSVLCFAPMNEKTGLPDTPVFVDKP